MNALGLILVIVLGAMLIGSIPRWNYSKGWGYTPSGALSVVLVLVILLMMTGRLHF